MAGMNTERERAAKGTRVGRQEVQHTRKSLEDLDALKRAWGLKNGSDVVREALEKARKALKKGGGR